MCFSKTGRSEPSGDEPRRGDYMVVINLDVNINVSVTLTVISHIKTLKPGDIYNISHLLNPLMSSVSYLTRVFLCVFETSTSSA